MQSEFSQMGGIRYGKSFWFSLNFTMPFARITMSRERMKLSVSILGLWKRTFEFERKDVESVRKKRGLLSTGMQIVHKRSDCPMFVLFWPSDYMSLKVAMEGQGYPVHDW